MTTLPAPAAALYAAYNRQDAAAAAACYAPDGRHREVAQGRVIEGPDAIAEGLASFLASFPDARWEPETVVDGGDAVAITYVLTGTLQARMGPFEPGGQRLELRGCHVLHLAGDRIAWSEDYWDGGTFGRQMRG